MGLNDHLELGPNCPAEDTDCEDCEERRKNGCMYALPLGAQESAT
jgi:hypothetical protein